MKNTTLIFLFAFSSVFALGQTNADILGEWYNAKEDIIITLFEDGKTVSGKITWMKFPNDENVNLTLDSLHSDVELSSRARVGMVIMSGFSHIAGKVWDNGSLYNFKKGKTYSGMITLKDSNTLDLRGYSGFSFIRRSSSTWTRNNIDVLKKVTKENLLIQLAEDLKEVIEEIEKENLLIQLREDLKQIITKIEELKKSE